MSFSVVAKYLHQQWDVTLPGFNSWHFQIHVVNMASACFGACYGSYDDNRAQEEGP
jgi:hypothetical protein